MGGAMALEREHLLPLPGEGFELAETSFPMVDTKGCVKVRTNWYSAPVKAGTAVQVKVQPAAIEVWQEGACVARHERCYERGHPCDGRPRRISFGPWTSPRMPWRAGGSFAP